MSGTNVGKISIQFVADLQNMEKGFAKAQKLIDSFAKNKDKIGVKIGADISKLETALTKASQIINDFDKKVKGKEIGKEIGEDIGEGIEDGLNERVNKIKNVFNKMENFAKKGMKKVTTPILGAGTAIWKMSANFEDAMAKVSTIADSSYPLENLKKEAIDVSRQLGIAVTDVAQAQYTAISAGVDTSFAGQFAKIAGVAAKAGGTDIETAIDGLTTVINAYNLESEHALAISDQMFKTQKLGKTTFGEMAQYLGNVIPIASALNVSTEELFASIAVLTKNGIQTNQAMTGLKAAFSNILKPSVQAAEAAEMLGLNFSASYVKSVGWSKFLEELREKTKGSETALADLFGSTEAVNSLLVLTGKGAKDFSDALDEIGNSAGATKEAYEKMLTPQERFRIAVNNLKLSLMEFGVAITPIIEKITEKINQFSVFINNMSDETKERIVKIAGAFALFFPALYIISKLGQSIFWIGAVITGTKGLISGFGKVMSGGFMAANAAVLLLIGSLALFIGVLWKAEDESTITARTIGEKFAKLGERALGVLKFIGGIIHSIFSITVSGISILVEKALGKIGDFMSGLQNIAEKLGLDWLSEKLGSGVNSIKGAIGKLEENRKELTGKSLDILDDAMYMMNKPFDSYMDKQVKKGKVIIEGEVGGQKVNFIPSEKNKFLFDNKGRLTEKAKEMLEKQREREFSIKVPELNLPEMELPEIELPEYEPDFYEKMKADFDKMNADFDEMKTNLDKGIPKASKKAEIATDAVAEAIKKLGNAFLNASDQIRGYIGIFDNFRNKTISPYRLLRNAQERAKAYLERERLLLTLENRGIPAYIMEELHKSGMDALGALRGLSYMSEEQLRQWVQYQNIGRASADRQAMNQVIIEHISIDARDRSIEEIERELYSRLRARGVSIW